MRAILAALIALVAGCTCAEPRMGATASSAGGPVSPARASSIDDHGSRSAGPFGGAAPELTAPGGGLTVERIVAALEPPGPAGDRRSPLGRGDPRRYACRLLTAAERGGARTAERWAKEHKQSGIINASMYGEDHRSIGLMVDGDVVDNGRDDPKFGGILALRPRTTALPEVTLLGRDCPAGSAPGTGLDPGGLDAVRSEYRTVFTNYRLLGCEGQAIAWKDAKAYSSAAIGVDRRGWVVLIHARTPFIMSAMSTMLAAPELGLAGAVYVEGGPEASLYVDEGGVRVREMGSYETGFHESDDSRGFWEIPNVLGFAPR